MSPRTLLWIVLCAVFFALFLRLQRATRSDEARVLSREQRSYQKLRGIISEQYVDEVKERDLFYGALQGMASVLDRHTAFSSPEQYELEISEIRGHFAGIGIVIAPSEGNRGVTVATPLLDTPAYKVLEPKDRILAIDGQPAEQLTMDQASKLIRGPAGSTVRLRVARAGHPAPLDFEIVRANIKSHSVQEATLLRPPETVAARIAADAPRIGYVLLTAFQEESAKDLEAALQKLEGEGLQALVLDLRQNHGGALTAAIDICDQFLPEGLTVVSTKDRNALLGKGAPKFYCAGKKPNPRTCPVVVLIDGDSASASEIVAGCLRDHRRAELVGEKSFGKGRVQSILNLEVDKVSEGHLKLTTAKYFTPSGVCIDGKGIQPDHHVPFSNEQIREMLLARRSRHWVRNDPRGNGRQPPLPETPPVLLPAAPSSPLDPTHGDPSGAKDGSPPSKSKAPFYDLQLEKAVEVLTRKLETGKPRPEINP